MKINKKYMSKYMGILDQSITTKQFIKDFEIHSSEWKDSLNKSEFNEFGNTDLNFIDDDGYGISIEVDENDRVTHIYDLDNYYDNEMEI
jgi:hypothetical protein